MGFCSQILPNLIGEDPHLSKQFHSKVCILDVAVMEDPTRLGLWNPKLIQLSRQGFFLLHCLQCIFRRKNAVSKESCLEITTAHRSVAEGVSLVKFCNPSNLDSFGLLICFCSCEWYQSIFFKLTKFLKYDCQHTILSAYVIPF